MQISVVYQVFFDAHYKCFPLSIYAVMMGIMSKDLCSEKALIFRIIHKDNLDSVLVNGCMSRIAAQQQAGYTEIGNLELIAKRNTREVPLDPFGTLSNYVPFYFTPYSPMLYNIKTGYSVPQQQMSDILVLVSSLYKLQEMALPFVFTDRHAYLRTAQFSNNLSNLDWIVWDVLQRRDFSRSDTDRFEKYQAEALVHNIAPINSLLGIVCYNDDVKGMVELKAEQYGADIKVVSQPKWYL